MVPTGSWAVIRLVCSHALCLLCASLCASVKGSSSVQERPGGQENDTNHDLNVVVENARYPWRYLEVCQLRASFSSGVLEDICTETGRLNRKWTHSGDGSW